MKRSKPLPLDLNKPEWEGILRISTDLFERWGKQYVSINIAIFPEDDLPFGITRVFNGDYALNFHKNQNITIPDILDLRKLEEAYGEVLTSIIENALVHINSEVHRYFLKDHKIM